MDRVIYTIGYGIIQGTHEERKDKFQKRLEYIQRGIGKPVTVVDIRKAGSGSRNGKWFRQVSGLAVIDYHMHALMRFLDGIEYAAESALFNEHGSTKQGLVKYRNELWFHLGPGRYEQEVFEAFHRVKADAEGGSRAVLLMCGCKDAFKKNGTTPNCHRVPLAEALVSELGEGWKVVHL